MFDLSRIQDYVNANNFNEEQRDAVLSSLLESDILKKALDTLEGKAILNDLVDKITECISTTTKLCIEDTSKNYDSIVQCGLRAQMLYRIMCEWARVLHKGKYHESKMEGE